MNKKILLLVISLMLALSAAAETITIGTGTSSQYLPYGSSTYTTTQFILTKDEIGRAGKITALAFYQLKNTYSNQTDIISIYMGHTSASTFSNSKPCSVIDGRNVYSLGCYLGENTGWHWHYLNRNGDTPFIYNGKDNLLIIINHRPDEKSSSLATRAYATSKSNACISRSGTTSAYADNANTSNYTTYQYRPNVQLQMEYFSSGNGTESSPYLIKNYDDLEYLSYLVNSGTGDFATKCYKMSANIDCYRRQFEPIGTSSRPFCGKFNGNNYAIQGLNFTLFATNEYAGLFGCINGATIENVTFTNNSTLPATYGAGRISASMYAGAVCGKATGKSLIRNCRNTSTSVETEDSYSSSYAGGICGALFDGSIVQECYNTSTISGPYVGGIVGKNYESSIVNCYNTGTINGSTYSGGIAGWHDRDDGPALIVSCINVGTISSGSNKGNIFGYCDEGTTYNCYWNNTTAIGVYTDSRRVVNCAKKDLSTGEVAYLLRTKTSEYTTALSTTINGDAWRQDIESDSYPVLDSSHSMVYSVMHLCCANASSYTTEYKNTTSNVIDNNLTRHARVEPTCTTSGNIEYWSCNKCGKKYTSSTSATNNEVTNISLSALGHNMVKTEGKDPTPTTSGNHPYWKCTRCNKYFADSNGSTSTTVANQTIPACPWHYPQYSVPTTYFASGTGFKDDPYLITSAQELANLAYFVNTVHPITHNNSVYFYKLQKDIDLQGYEWTPIGGRTDGTFIGTFDGNGHSITGLKITGQSSCSGLFGSMGRNGYVTEIQNLTVKGSISGGSSVGAIAGSMSYSEIFNCAVDCSVSGTTDVGGIVGYMTSKSSIGHCISNNSVGISGTANIGGIVGYARESSITVCYNISKVSASSNYAGGICGDLSSNMMVHSSFNRGSVSGSNSGALVGRMQTSLMLGFCFYLNTTSSKAIGSTPSDYDGPYTNITGIIEYEAATLAQCQSGYVSYFLTRDNEYFRQNLGSDTYPVVDPSHKLVYQVQEFCCTHGTTSDTGYSNTNQTVYVNSLTYHPAKAASCSAAGNIEYWTCNTCGKLYADANATKETTLAAVTISQGTHNFSNGFCSNCGEYEVPEIANEYYQINNAGKLFWFAQQVNAGSTSINGKLTANITVNSNVLTAAGELNGTPTRVWAPIGNTTYPYNGTFEGQSFTIKGLYRNTSSQDRIGLFGTASNATIQNLTISDSYFCGNNNVGGLCGYANSVKIAKCNNESRVKGTNNVGGIIGYTNGECKIDNCVNSRSVSGTYYVGGIVGKDDNSNLDKDRIHCCINNAPISGSSAIGGIIGKSYTFAIRDCGNYAAVSGSYSGGICGEAEQVSYISSTYVYYEYTGIYNCLNIASVTGNYSGSIIGQLEDYPVVSNCYYDSSRKSNAVGSGNSTSGATGKTNFSTGEVTYLLNGSKTATDECNWYQNIDSGTKDAYPIPDDSHGDVYAMPALGFYTNTAIVPATLVTVVSQETAVGQSLTMAATISPANATVNTATFQAKGYNPISWSGGTSSVATINQTTGAVTATGNGTATFTASVLDGSDKTGSASVRVYLLGDANGNDKVNIADVSTIAAKLNGLTPASYHFAPANANFTDATINSADITTTLGIAWNGVGYSAPARRAQDRDHEPTRLYALSFSAIRGTEAILSILVDNPSETFSAFDFSMELPNGFHAKKNLDGTIMAQVSTERTTLEKTDNFTATQREDGSIYVLCYSTQLEQFEAESGTVANLVLEMDQDLPCGEYEIAINDIVLSGYGEIIACEDNVAVITVVSPDGIELINAEPDTDGWVYDLKGQLVKVDGQPTHSLEALPSGIYIINGQKVRK